MTCQLPIKKLSSAETSCAPRSLKRRASRTKSYDTNVRQAQVGVAKTRADEVQSSATQVLTRNSWQSRPQGRSPSRVRRRWANPPSALVIERSTTPETEGS